MEHFLRPTPQLSKLAATMIEDAKLHHHPYFETLRNGCMSKERFIQSQEAFFFVTEFLQRPMSALVSRLPSGNDRLHVMHSLVLECGEPNSEHNGLEQFKTFLQNLGSEALPLDHEEQIPHAVRVFNQVLISTAHYENVNFAIAYMGCLQCILSEIFQIIAHGIIERQFLDKNQMVYYSLQADSVSLQTREALFAIIEPLWVDGTSKAVIEQGFEFAFYNVDSLYRELVDI
ncbi:MAG: iron-containing redox enzyme family protein [Pseudomonadota bacterium]